VLPWCAQQLAKQEACLFSEGLQSTADIPRRERHLLTLVVLSLALPPQAA
jgi:hypothetical protein